jgi:hypothetical protein
MLAWLRRAGKVSQRKLRLFSCAAVRLVWHFLDERGQAAVEAAEGLADRTIKKDALLAARQAAFAAWREGQESDGAAYAAYELAQECIRTNESQGTAWGYAAKAAGWEEQPALLRDIFGPRPFFRKTIHTSVLRWRDGIVVRLAQLAYDERMLPAGTLAPGHLAILADALEEAGVGHDSLLQHLRGPGRHVRGCFAVDALLGKS